MTAVPLVIIVAMTIALIARARPLLDDQSVWGLLTGRTWQPFQGQFGFYPFIAGTLWVTALAMLLAVPPSLLTAIYLAEYARPADAGGGEAGARPAGRHPLGGLRHLGRDRHRAVGGQLLAPLAGS